MSDITYLAASNAAREPSGVNKQRNLCSECRELNFSASGFFLPNGKGNKGPVILYTRPWSLIRDATDCSLCQLIVFAVRAASEERLIQEAPWQCQLTSCILPSTHRTAKDEVMALKFVAQYNWTSVSDFLIPVQSEDYPGAFPGRVIRPGQIDVKQVHRWLQQCETEHAGTCRHLNRAGNMMVIDVDAQCLRMLPNNGRYIALSYVWGGVEQVETTMSNLEEFGVPGAFGQIAHGIPKTIRDAMEFVKQLGEKFLWVDALCIIQDDLSTKQRMIDHMNVIYANAYATLFAAFGDNAHAGLPGVSPSFRNIDQPMATVADGLTFIYPTWFKVIKKSAWATRGWTWASRRPGFPSWSWAGWKGTIVMQNYSNLSNPLRLQQKSWIKWYVYDEKKANFVLISSGHRAALQEILSKGDNSLDTSSNAISDNRQGPRASASSETTTWNSTVALLLSQLSLNSAEEALTPRLTPSPASCILNLDSSTLLFRTLTAYLTISALKPNGQKPCTPHTDPSPLPSTPNLYLYTTSGVHVGTAWVSSEDTYNEIVRNDEQHNDRPSTEVVILLGSVTGDWRTRKENLTAFEYKLELVMAGLDSGDWESQNDSRMEYESLIGDIYDRMIKERASGATRDPNAQLPSDFWELLATRAGLEIAESGKFPGHTAAELQHAIGALKAGKFLGDFPAYLERIKDGLEVCGHGWLEEFSVGFLQILLTGKLGVADNNGSAGAKERIGIGEIREDRLSLIDGLALRDVLLR
ncbi:hypothetical protein Trihar35433_4076 [Trichoderma harzianum]|nr:hypothetical protein Trihar35433_4076 [Trichoderma harzianum]